MSHINWETRLKQAKTRGFTLEDKKAAGSWETCAVSELKVDWIGGNIKNGPNDLYLILDGISFMNAVEKDDYSTAVRCFESLHKRAETISRQNV